MLNYEEFTALRRRQEAAVDAELRAIAASSSSRRRHDHSSDDDDDDDEGHEGEHHHHHHHHLHSDVGSEDDDGGDSDDDHHLSDMEDDDPLARLISAKKAGLQLPPPPSSSSTASAARGGGDGKAVTISPSKGPPAAMMTTTTGKSSSAEMEAAAGAAATTSSAAATKKASAGRAAAASIPPPAAAATTSPPPPAAAAGASPSSPTATGTTLVHRLGVLVESYEAQAVMLALIAADVLATVVLVVTDQGKDPWGSSGGVQGAIRRNVISLIESLSALLLLVSVLEVVMLFLAFKSRLASHLGYMTDLLLLALFLYQQLLHNNNTTLGQCREVRLLSLVRVSWRAFRLVSTMLEGSRADKDEVARQLQQEKTVVSDLRTEVSRLEDTVRREREGRRRLNDMLQGYKDEVETLNEALKIAALDVALVAEESGSEEDDEDLLLMHGQGEEEHRPPNTIFVNEDGTYEIK